MAWSAVRSRCVPSVTAVVLALLGAFPLACGPSAKAEEERRFAEEKAQLEKERARLEEQLMQQKSGTFADGDGLAGEKDPERRRQLEAQLAAARSAQAHQDAGLPSPSASALAPHR